MNTLNTKNSTLKILVTGVAGFIGMQTAKRLLEQLEPFKNFRFIKMDLADREGTSRFVEWYQRWLGASQ